MLNRVYDRFQFRNIDGNVWIFLMNIWNAANVVSMQMRYCQNIRRGILFELDRISQYSNAQPRLAPKAKLSPSLLVSTSGYAAGSSLGESIKPARTNLSKEEVWNKAFAEEVYELSLDIPRIFKAYGRAKSQKAKAQIISSLELDIADIKQKLFHFFKRFF